MSRLFPAAVACLPAAALAATFAGVEVPPPPPPQPVVDTHWGVKVEDPYRFLESTGDAKVQAWMRAQADATQAILAKIPGRERVLARIKEIDADSPPVVGNIERDDRGGLFYLKREPKDSQYKLYRRESVEGAETLLVDPEVESKATGKPHAIDEFKPSPDGRKLAYLISSGGGEIGTLHVIDLATRKPLTPSIDGVRGAAVGWLNDGSGFFYSRLAEGWEKRPRAERFKDVVTRLRRLDAPDKDLEVFGPGVHADVPIERTDFSALFAIPGQTVVLALVFHGVDPNRSAYAAELADVLAGKARWRKLFDRADLVNSATVGGRHLYVKTAKDAPRYKVLRTPLAAPDLGAAEAVFPAGDEVIVGLSSARDALYVTRREGAIKRLFRVAHEPGAKPVRIALPVDGNVTVADADLRIDGAILQLGSWTRAAKYYALGAKDMRPSLLPLVPPGKFDAPAGLVAREVKVRSHDGVEVPMSIISRADIRLDGSNPTIVYGYAAYGNVEDPAWSPRLLAWFEHGGAYAIVHARGGGIYGDAWRRAGWKTTKHNTWKDGIAAAEWLVANGYSSVPKLSIYGGSAGAIFAGRAITERPDLFGAAVIAVGNTDSLRSETRANGAGNIPEYGTFTKEDEFRGLLAMSPYANVKPGTAYPAVMLEHGVNDSRVDVWMTLKMASRLAAATTSGEPVLMRLEYAGGHGPGATREQAQSRTADRFSFLLWQAGLREFQPR